MAFLNDFSSRFRKGLSSASPFLSAGLRWCQTCRMEVDTNTESRHRGTTYAYKQTCRRCGGVIDRGVYDNVPILSGQPLPPAAVEWTLEPAKATR